MVRKFRVGNVLQTGAVVTDIPVVMGEIPYFSKGEKNQFKLTMADEDAVYGLGEQVRGINKRGFIYESNCMFLINTKVNTSFLEIIKNTFHL